MDLASVPDPRIFTKMMGTGSPSNLQTETLFHRLRGSDSAVSYKTRCRHPHPFGAELLIHVGLDTVNMNGEGFEAHVKEGDKVKTGDLLLTCNLDLIKKKQATPSSLW